MVQACLAGRDFWIFSTQILQYLPYRLGHPGLSPSLHPAAPLQEPEAAGDTKLGWMSTTNEKEKTKQQGGMSQLS